MSEVEFLVERFVEELRYPPNGLRIVFDIGDRVDPLCTRTSNSRSTL